MCPQIYDPQIFTVVQTTMSNSRLTYTVFNLHPHCVSWKHLNLTCSKLNSSSFPTNLFTQNKSHSSYNGLESFPWRSPLPFDLTSTIPPPSSPSTPATASSFFFIEYLRFISVCGVCHGYSLRLYLSLHSLTVTNSFINFKCARMSLLPLELTVSTLFKITTLPSTRLPPLSCSAFSF